MNALIEAAIHHARTVLMTLALLLIAGSYAYIDIAKESSPDINIPNIYISAYLEGISPEDSERLILRPLEQELSTIEGIKEMKSTAYLGGGFVLLEFQAGFDKDKALDDVQKAVDQVRPDLPDDMDEPQVTEVNFSLFPVLVVTLSGDVPERTLLRLARNLQDKIEGLGEVLEAPIAGNRDEQVEIVIDPVLIESYGLNGNELLQFFTRSNKLVAAGNLDSGAGRFAVKVPGLFESLSDILGMPVLAVEDSVIKLRDIAEIRRTFEDPENFAYLNGKPALAIEVIKRSGENVIDTIEKVRNIVAEEQKLWPVNVDVTFTQDQSDRIRTMLQDLQNNVISAVLLVMIVIVAVMGVRAAGLVGVAIPGAFLTGILAVYIMGLTVNVVVLFALILSVGLLVDGAIVVTEYADRKMSEGLDRKEAYMVAAKRMSWPIAASTATTLAAFAPLLFWPGIVGQFMKFMPITLIAVLTSSLAMALIFVPTLGSLIGKPGAANDPETMKSLAASETGNLDEIGGFTGWYLRRLESVLKFPGMVLLIAFILLIAVQSFYAKYGHGVEFFPDIEPEVATVLIHARGNLSVYEQDMLVREVSDRVAKTHGIQTMYTRSGEAAAKGNLAEDVIGQIQIEFTPWDTRPTANEIMNDIRSRTKDLAGIHVETQEEQKGPPTGKALQLQLQSRFPELLPGAVETLLGALDQIGDFIDIEDSRPLPGIEWKLEVDRAQAAKFGVDITAIGNAIRLVTNGLEISEYRPNDSDDEIDIVARHSLDRRTLNQLDRVSIEGPNGSIPIGNFVRRVAEPAVGTINRADQMREITIKADLPDGMNINAKVEDVKNWIAEHPDAIDPRIQLSFKGEDEDQREAQAFLMKAFIIALFIMAIILVTQFNSFYSALLILSAVIMSTIGVMLGLLIMGNPFGIVMTGIGVIALAGIIVNNNIVLIDTYDHLMASGKFSVHEAVLRTGAQRLRPVLMTTVTTGLGLLPMVLQINIDFLSRDVQIGAPSTQWWVDLSTAVVFGLIFSTVLTLMVTPAALMFRQKFSNRHPIQSLKDRLRKPQSAE